MKIIRGNVGTMFISDDIMQWLREYDYPVVSFETALVRATLGYEYERIPVVELGILHAHGWQDERGIWVHCDGSKVRPVEDWVAEQNGRFNYLLLLSCESTIFQAKKSYLLIPDEISFSNPDPKDPYRGGHEPVITLVPPRRD